MKCDSAQRPVSTRFGHETIVSFGGFARKRSETNSAAAWIRPSLSEKMRARIDQCRRLAQYINDARTTDALLKMADDGEAEHSQI
jgi:hypothetical protein